MGRIRIFESDNWIIEKNNEGNIIITYFSDGHYKGEIELNIKNEINVTRFE